MKRILSIALILSMVLWLSACKKTGGSSSDIESDLLTSINQSISETENSKDEPKASEEENSETDSESEKSPTNTVTENTLPSSSPQSSGESTEPKPPAESNKTPVQSEAPKNEPTTRQKLIGTWRFTIPENTLSEQGLIYPGYRLVYDLMISTNDLIILAEKQFKQSDTETVGEVEYFDGKRYTLMYNSLALIQGSFTGEISIASENEAVFELYGYETQTGRFYIEETHSFTLIDDTHLQWSNSEIYSEWLDEQYFPWNASTVFTKK